MFINLTELDLTFHHGMRQLVDHKHKMKKPYSYWAFPFSTFKRLCITQSQSLGIPLFDIFQLCFTFSHMVSTIIHFLAEPSKTWDNAYTTKKFSF